MTKLYLLKYTIVCSMCDKLLGISTKKGKFTHCVDCMNKVPIRLLRKK